MKKNYKKNFLFSVCMVFGIVIFKNNLYAQSTLVTTYTVNFAYTGAPQTFTVPSCVATITIEARGAQGAAGTSAAGMGGIARGVMTVTSGQVLSIYVGGQATGFNGGGTGNTGGNGGGASDVRVAPATLADRVIVAGGGGGGGSTNSNAPGGGGGSGTIVGTNFVGGGPGMGANNQGPPVGGAVGATNGGAGRVGNGSNNGGAGGGGGLNSGGFGGTNSGYGSGGNGSLGIGGNAGGVTGAAGGGGGYYGGGGSSGGANSNAGGGGGSSWTGTLTSPSFTAGAHTGNGAVTFIYTYLGPINTSISNSVICEGESTNLGSTGLTTYSWSTGSNSPSITVSPTVSSNYTISGINSFSCVASAVISVSVNPLPLITVVSSPTLLCVGSTAILTATGAASYTWSPSGPVSQTLAVNPVTSTVYNLSGTSLAGCVNTSSFNLNVNTLTLTVPANTAVCTGKSIELTASGAVSYQWSTGLPFASITVTPAVATVYSVTAVDANGCSHAGSVSVSVTPLPNVTASAVKTVVCKGEPVTLTAGGAGTYLWSSSTNTSISTNTSVSITHTVDVTFNYSVTGTTNGCSNTATIAIKVNKCTGISEEGDLQGQSILYPNPNFGVFTLEFENKQEQRVVRIYSLSGALVKTLKANELVVDLNLEQEADGVYMVEILHNEKIMDRIKMVKEKH